MHTSTSSYRFASRTAAVLVAGVLTLLFLVSGLTPAHADPYPPSAPTSSAAAAAASSTAGPTDPQVQPASQNEHAQSTAYTGFAAVTATLLATGLLAGGVLFLVAGRRRRTDH